MKTKITSLLFILVSAVVFGQTAEPVSSSKVSIGISFSPDYCYRSLHPKSSYQFGTEFRDTMEVAKLGYTTGLSLLYKPWDRISFETGLYFSDKGYKTKVIDLYDINPPTHLAVNRAKTIYHYYYLDIPIKLNYYLLKGKVDLFVSAGVSANIYLSSRAIFKLEDPEETQTTSSSGDLSQLNMAVLIGGGVDYEISNRLNLRIEPIFRHAITPVVDAPIKEYQYSIGTNFGLYYTLSN